MTGPSTAELDRIAAELAAQKAAGTARRFDSVEQISEAVVSDDRG